MKETNESAFIFYLYSAVPRKSGIRSPAHIYISLNKETEYFFHRFKKMNYFLITKQAGLIVRNKHDWPKSNIFSNCDLFCDRF